MTKAGERILDGAREALAIAKGEQPAASITVRGHKYVPAREWRPIETVEDGATVLVYAPNEVTRPVFEATAYRNGSYNDPVYDEWDGDGITHWMPLPTPPSDIGR